MNDYLPARMLNEFTYCPRLYYYEHVEGVFVHNRETVEGELAHRRVDAQVEGLPPPAELVEGAGREAQCRSVMLSSDHWGVIAKMDLVECRDGQVIPVDYKRGRPRRDADGELTAWDTDQIQLAVQAIVLREHGYRCEQAVVYYAATRQRVRLAIDPPLLERTRETVRAARRVAEGEIPPPLVDSPKCPRCSLVGVCLPEETHLLQLEPAAPAAPRQPAGLGGEAGRAAPPGWRLGNQRMLFDIGPVPQVRGWSACDDELRRLVPARDDQRPCYLNQPGLHVGKSGEVLRIKDRGKLVQEVRLRELSQLNLLGNVQLTTQAVHAACQLEVPIAYFSGSGWFYGLTSGLGVRNIFLRREQFRWAAVPSVCLELAKELTRGKIRNQRTLLQRNHVEPPRRALAQLKALAEQLHGVQSGEELLGVEGNAARIYFSHFAGMLKVGPDQDPFRGAADDRPPAAGAGERGAEEEAFTFDFRTRNRRPPRDPVNALLSLAYSLLAKDLTITSHLVGFDPFLGFYHQPRYGRPALALDLMEPFRPLIADSAVLTAINTRMVTPRDFVRAGDSVALTPKGRKGFFRAYEGRMDTLVTHPRFGYRVSYRRILEIQTRLLARVLTGELGSYAAFTTR